MQPQPSHDLIQFFAANFHEDWDLDADTPEAIIALYAAHNRVPGRLSALATELDALVASIPDDVELRRIMFEVLGNCYLPPGDLAQLRVWLGAVSAQLRSAQTP